VRKLVRKEKKKLEREEGEEKEETS